MLSSTENHGFTSYAVETKAGKEYFVEGYIATYDKDRVNDVITKSAMQDIYDQADVIKVDLEHEAFRPDEEGYGRYGSREALIPVAKIISKKLDDTGVWVKAQLNHHLEAKFKSLWGSLQDRFVNAFSIAFAEPPPDDYVIRKSDGARLLGRIRTLLNVALTGNAVNTKAAITAVVAKSRDMIFNVNENLEEPTMTDDEKPVGDETPPEQPKDEEPAPTEEVKTELPEENAELKAILDRIDKIESLISKPPETTPQPEMKAADLKAVTEKLDKLEEQLKKPVLKAEATLPDSQTPEEESLMQFIQ